MCFARVVPLRDDASELAVLENDEGAYVVLSHRFESVINGIGGSHGVDGLRFVSFARQ